MRDTKARKKIEALFRTFNRKYFGGTLPTPEIAVIPAGMAGDAVDRHSWAAVGEWVGGWVMEVRLLDLQVDKTYLAAIVLHEMAHVKLFREGIRHDHRSKAWKDEIHRLSLAGALREVI